MPRRKIPRILPTTQPMVVQFVTTTPNESITLPLINTGTYNCKGVWSDGTVVNITAWNDPDKTHIIASPGIHTLKLYGTCTRWRFHSDPTSAANLYKILNFGDMGWTSVESMFRGGCTSLVGVYGGGEYLSNVADFSQWYNGCTSLVDVYLTINGSNATTCQSTFIGCSSLVTLANFIITNTNSVTNWSYFIRDCPLLETMMAALEVGGGQNFTGFAQNDTSLVNIPAVLDVSNGLYFDYQWYGTAIRNLPTVYDVSNGLTFNYMLANSAIEALPTIFNVVSATLLGYIIYNCVNLSSGTLQNAAVSFDMTNCGYDGAGLDAMYTALAVVIAATITVTGNPGTGSDTPSIATAKNWTVTGS